MIGANGAGKSTLMTIFGDPRPCKGQMLFEGRDITGLPAHEITKLHIAHSPEECRIFGRMTVMENLQMGATVSDETQFEEVPACVFRLFLRLKERLHQRGGTLSGGEQQMPAIASALMSRPRVLLLDEPSLGLAHRNYVMVNGVITVSGAGRELLQRPEVRAAYLQGGRQLKRADHERFANNRNSTRPIAGFHRRGFICGYYYRRQQGCPTTFRFPNIAYKKSRIVVDAALLIDVRAFTRPPAAGPFV